MSVGSPDFWIALMQIIGVNIVLSGDNAVVIALAARGLPAHQQKKAVAWGSGAAVLMRRQAARRQRDDHRVVARENDIHADDLQQRDPEFGGLYGHRGLLLRRIPPWAAGMSPASGTLPADRRQRAFEPPL